MQNKQPWERFFKSSDSQDLLDLPKDVILEIGAGGVLIVWVVMVAAIGYNGKRLNLLVPVFIIFVFFQRYLVEGISTTGLKG